jgi:PAS domain S-box-containing protein
MDEQDEMQRAATSLSTDDFGMGQLFWEMRDAVVVGDADTGRIVLWNPAATALFGITAAEAVGQSIEILVPEPFRERHRAGLARFRKSGSGTIVDTGQVMELPALRGTGEQITIELTLSPLVASRVPGHFVLAVIRDVTERKQAELDRLRLLREQAARAAAKVETALHEAEIKFRSLVEQLPAIVSLNAHDESSSTLYISPQIEEILGYAPAEYTADPTFWLQTVHPDDVERVLAEIARTNVTGEPFRMEYRKVTRDGRVIWILDEGVLVRDNAGRPLHWQTVQLDITDRKRSAEELRQSEERFRTAFNHAAIGMSLVDLDGRFFRVNTALCDLTGYSESELLATTFQEITHPDDLEADLAQMAKLLAGEIRAFQMEKRLLRKDGRVVWIRLNSALVRDAQGAPLHFIGQLEDITERKRASEELRVALEVAQAANQAKGSFLDMMSHELRTPLQAVLGYSEFLLERQDGLLTGDQREDIGYIHQAGGRMIALINQILDLSRMEAGRLELAAEPVDLVQVIEQVRQDVAPQAAAKSLVLQIDLPSSLPFVIGDAERLRQVLLNLVGNAVKFTDEGCVRITAVSTSVGGVDVIVSDTGVGIPADAVPFIFDEFRQVESGLTRRHGGAGLGLAIARKLTEQMGGSISVTSDLGLGSTVTLHLPVGRP